MSELALRPGRFFCHFLELCLLRPPSLDNHSMGIRAQIEGQSIVVPVTIHSAAIAPLVVDCGAYEAGN